MKHIILLSFFIPVSAICMTSKQKKDKVKDKIPKTWVQPKQEFEFTFGYKAPLGAFADGFKSSSNTTWHESLTKSLEGDVGGIGAKGGYQMAFSRYIYYNKKPVQTIGGLKITYLSFSSVPFEWKTTGDYVYNFANYNKLAFLSFKIGPVMRIATSAEAAFRFYHQLGIEVAWNGSWDNVLDYQYYDQYKNRYSVHDDSDFRFRSGIGMKNDIGVSFNYDWFLLDFGFSFGKIKFKHVQSTRSIGISLEAYNPYNGTYKYYTSDNASASVSASPKVPVNTLHFSVGCRF